MIRAVQYCLKVRILVNRSRDDEADSPGSDILESTAILGNTAEPGGDTTLALGMQSALLCSPPEQQSWRSSRSLGFLGRAAWAVSTE